MTAKTWKEVLADRIAPDLAEEIDIFETQIELRRQGKIDEKIFAETRLRRGVYGQRYDNGRRYDGIKTQDLNFPSGELTKGPNTAFDAPGMMRIKIPYGAVSPEQMEVMADLAEEYSDGILHVTTRQDIQLHFVHIGETPDLMRRLAAVGITTREACGNSVRNVTGCPLAGVCHTEAFDVSPYAKVTMQFLLGHKDVQDFGRKFKIAFSGCADQACGLAKMHDIGCIAKTRIVDGVEQRGFEFWVGGGLGAVPHQAKLYEEFLLVEELLPTCQGISRVFARLGEKRNRATARLKFLVAKLGLDEFKRIVREEMESMPKDERWQAMIREAATAPADNRAKEGDALNGRERPEGYEAWAATNVYRQRQEGYAAATLTLPLGDFTSSQARVIADLCRTYCGESIRLTVDQNMMLRWVSEADLPEVYAALDAAGLGEPGAQSIVDITACPGTDTCKLGISSSRGLAAELRTRLAVKAIEMDEAVRNLTIKISGCFNSCGQHHVADIGFYGVTRKRHGYSVPFFQLVLGGQWDENAGAYGLATGAIPSRNIPEALDRITERFIQDRQKGESFQSFVRRVGKANIRKSLLDLEEVPGYDVDRSYYSDWGDPREYTLGDLGVGECAGELVSPLEFGLSAAERQVFQAQLAMEDAGDLQQAAEGAVSAMYRAAQELVRVEWQDVPDDREVIVEEFRKRFFDSRLFFDPYAGAKFANYFLRVASKPLTDLTSDTVHRLIEQAQLFIEAAHACSNRIGEQAAASD